MKYKYKSSWLFQCSECQHLNKKIKILAKQVLVNQLFTCFSLLVTILIVLKIYGFRG